MSPDDPDPGLPTSGHLLLTHEGETPPWPSVAACLTAGLDGDRRLVYLHDRSDPGKEAHGRHVHDPASGGGSVEREE